MGIIVECVRCGKDVERRACEAGKKYYYCSPQCRDTRRTKPCERCGALFVFRKCEEAKRFCSKACHYGPRPRLTCEWCKVEFSVKRCDVWRKHCSRKCADEQIRQRPEINRIDDPSIGQVPLNGGGFAIVDSDQLAAVLAHAWYKKVQNNTRTWYAFCRMIVRGKSRLVGLHRFVMGDPMGEVDHINMDGLDNRLANLRLVSKNQQQMNQLKRPGCASRYRGVSKKRKGWSADIRGFGVRYRLGAFAREEDAAKAYDAAARRIHGEFARLNFPLANERSAHTKGTHVTQDH